MDLFIKTINPIVYALRQAQMDRRQLSTIILAGGSAHIPKIKSFLTRFFRGQSLSDQIDPSYVIAWGAAIHADSIINQI
jgi:molecular chaperone DnaK (HSP70)